MALNATFNNISVISLGSVLLVEETGVPGENHRPVASHSLYCLMVCFESWASIFVVSTKYIDPWILEPAVIYYRQQSIEKLYFVGFYFSWFK